MKPAAIIFDFDGTIADTMGFLTRLAEKLISKHYRLTQEDARKRYLATTGLPFGQQLMEIFPDSEINETVAVEFENQKALEILHCPPFPDALSLLAKLRTARVKTFICSSTVEPIIAEYCAYHGLTKFLTGHFGLRPDFNKHQQLDYVVDQYKLTRAQVLFVGDSLKDSRFAGDAGLRFIGLTRIFSNADFAAIGADSVDSLDRISNQI